MCKCFATPTLAYDPGTKPFKKDGYRSALRRRGTKQYDYPSSRCWKYRLTLEQVCLSFTARKQLVAAAQSHNVSQSEFGVWHQDKECPSHSASFFPSFS